MVEGRGEGGKKEGREEGMKGERKRSSVVVQQK